jgi:hypothetical protein
LAGVDDFTALRRAADRRDSLSVALTGRPPGATILLSHTPWQAERAASAGVGLMLSGHTHGGQIWPFGYLTGLIYPLLQGRYEVDGTTVIVCRGTGVWGPRMRLWRPSEILRVTLHGREKSYALSYNRTAFRASTGYCFERVYTLHGEESVKVGGTLSACCAGPKEFFSNA